MTTWADEVVAIPVDPDSGVREPFITTVKRDVVIDLALVLLHKLFGAPQTRFFLDRKNKNQITLCFDGCRIKSANHRQQRFNVARVVSDSRRVHSAFPNVSFDFESGLKNCIEVGIENYHWAAARSFAHGNEVARGVVANALQLVV